MNKAVFLSWTGADEAFVNAVRQKIEAEFGKDSVIFSNRDCVGDFEKWSVENAKSSRIVLLFATPNLMSNPGSYAYGEIAAAYDEFEREEKGGAAYRIIPIFSGEVREFEFTSKAGRPVKLCADDKTSAVIWKGGHDDPASTEELIENVRAALCRVGHREYMKVEAEALDEGIRVANPILADQQFNVRPVDRHLINGVGERYNADPNELKTKTVVVADEPGSGKSVFGRQYFKRFSDAAAKSGNDLVLPFLVTASDYAYAELKANTQTKLESAICDKYEDDGLFDWLFKTNSFCKGLYLIIDGYDEFRGDLIGDVAKLGEKLKKKKNMTLGVMYLSRYDPVKGGDHDVVRLSPINRAELIAQYLEDEEAADFRERLTAVDETLKGNPLILTMLISLYIATGRFPVTRYAIYDEAVGYGMMVKDETDETLEALCKTAYGSAINGRDFLSAKKESGGSELVERSRFVREGKGFLHESYRDYFLVKYTEIFPEEAAGLEESLCEAYGDREFENILRFYFSMRFEKAKNAADIEALREGLFKPLLDKKIGDLSLLLRAASETSDRWVRLYLQSFIAGDILTRALNGELPPYGPLFLCGPEYGLYAAAVFALRSFAAETPERIFKAMALVRDLCFIYGMYPTAEKVKEIYFAGGRPRLDFGKGVEEAFDKARFKERIGSFGAGVRRTLCELFFVGESADETDYDIYPRCFDPVETRLLAADNIGRYGRRAHLFEDELGLWKPENDYNEYQGMATGLVTCADLSQKTVALWESSAVSGVIVVDNDGSRADNLKVHKDRLRVRYISESCRELCEYGKDGALNLRCFADEDGVVYVRVDTRDYEYIFAHGEDEEDDEELTEEDAPAVDNKIGIFPYDGRFDMSGREDIKKLFPNMFRSSGVREVILNGEITELPSGAFAHCRELENIDFKNVTVIGDECFLDSALVSAESDKVTEIEKDAFYACIDLKSARFTAARSVGDSAFYYCESIRELVFPKLTDCGRGAFYIYGYYDYRGFDYSESAGYREPLPADDAEAEEFWIYSLSREPLCCPEGYHSVDFGELLSHADRDDSRYWNPDESGMKLAQILMTRYFRTEQYAERFGPLPGPLHQDERDNLSEAFLIRLKYECDAFMYDFEWEIRKRINNIIKLWCGVFDLNIIAGNAEYFAEATVAVLLSQHQTAAAEWRSRHERRGETPAAPEKEEPETYKTAASVRDNLFSIDGDVCTVFAREDGVIDGIFYFIPLVGPSEELIRTVVFADGVREIRCFFNEFKNLTEVRLAESVKVIGMGAFSECEKLEKIGLSSVERIETMAFKGCDSLTEVEAPACDYLAPYAFDRCRNLKSARVGRNGAAIFSSAFDGCEKLEFLALPERVRTEEEKNAFGAPVSSDVFVIPESVVEIVLPEGVRYCKMAGYLGSRDCKIETVVAPGAELIQSNAFKDCSGLRAADFPKAEKIGAEAFKGCAALQEINAPEVNEIYSRAFKDCAVLESVDFPKAEKIDAGAFEGCAALKKIVLSSIVTSVGEQAFKDCAALEEIDLGNADVGENAFAGCVSLKRVKNLYANLSSPAAKKRIFGERYKEIAFE